MPTASKLGPTRLNEDQIKQQAHGAAEALAAYAESAEQQRRLPQESVEIVRGAGLVRTIQAAVNGGHELPMRSHVDVISTVAEACAATAWVLGVYHAHSWMLTHFPAQAQRDVYAESPDATVSAVIGPRGRATRRIDGTFVLHGFWPFGSGCEHSDWLILGAEIFDENDTKIDEGDLLLPTSQADIQDDWDMSGLRGTGSNSIVVENLAVPAHRFLSLAKLIERDSPAYNADVEGSVNKAQAVPVLALCIVASSLGIARSALSEFRRLVPGKRVQYTAHVADDWSPIHVALGVAASKINAAGLVLYSIANDIDDYATRGDAMPIELRARIRMDCAMVVRLLLEAVDDLFLNAGASALSTKNILQRASRDLHAINMHGLLLFSTNAELYGRVLLGKDPETAII